MLTLWCKLKMGTSCCADKQSALVPELLRHINLNSTGLQVVYSDPADEELDGVLVYLTQELMPIGPTSSALYRKEGSELTVKCQEEAMSRGGIHSGDVLVIESTRIQAKYLVCVICPDQPLESIHDLLISAMTIASFKGIQTLAVPIQALQSDCVSLEKQVEVYFQAIQRFVATNGDFRLIRVVGMDMAVAGACGQEFNRHFPQRLRGRTANLRKNCASMVL